MAMSRKDFQALADGLKATRPTLEPHESKNSDTYLARENQWYRDVRIVADACKAANPAFKREAFYTACGMVD